MRRKCEECYSEEIRINYVEGTISCYNCGLVQESRIIEEATALLTNCTYENDGKNYSYLNGGLSCSLLSNAGMDTVVGDKKGNKVHKHMFVG